MENIFQDIYDNIQKSENLIKQNEQSLNILREAGEDISTMLVEHNSVKEKRRRYMKALERHGNITKK